MNQKQIGIILIIIGLIIGTIVYLAKQREDKAINLFIEEAGTCFLDDGTCLHNDRDLSLYIIGWVVSAALILFGVYLSVFDKTQEMLAEHQVKVANALQEASKKDEFSAYLAGFNEDEKNILRAIKEQDGIQQSTLRFRVGLSKAKLSIILKSLEDKDIINRNLVGKTNKVYLRKKF